MKSRSVSLFALTLILAACTPAPQPPGPPVTLQLLNVSDWHAELASLSIDSKDGGAAVLSASFNKDRAENPNTLTLTADDAFGASPPLASFFDAVPALLAMNAMEFDADTLGNHNCDKGTAFLQGLIDQANFPYLSANLSNLSGNLNTVAPDKTFEVGGVNVAVAVSGLTNPEVPTLVSPSAFGTLKVPDPVAAIQVRIDIQAQGAQTFVVLTRMGMEAKDAARTVSVSLIDLAQGLTGFDVILGDHTNVQSSGTIGGALVLEHLSKGTLGSA
ncbi:bifunctional metallophosphatase/5'-nucleotidase [Deinococcus humi]|uniref:5'-nucleotidase n=1 Tax=Deinococcus humi TaxID=662880 RepID=A0A7W8JZB5_9DEIO|nr:bifunctional metallophosphatase/5'-nucleotidase [Deinococcus humi]MBB5365990.1 5'-nucleotidase [Deinococcus humi]GGO39791.1 hypothetical protein GCM10008949_48360 [Deinococcus humi]